MAKTKIGVFYAI